MYNPLLMSVDGLMNDGTKMKREVFLCLLESEEGMTPSQIGSHVDETRQKVMYHLKDLVDSGVVINDEGVYFCQPVFVDSEVGEEIERVFRELAEVVESNVYVSPSSEKKEVIANCLRVISAMEVLDAPLESPEKNPE